MIATDINVSGWVLIGYAAVACAYDWRYRRIPNWFTLVYALFCVSGWYQEMLAWSWEGAGAGLLMAVVAGVAGGDLKLMIVLGGLSSPLIILVASAIAFWLSILSFVAQRRGWYPSHWRVSLWPLSPFIAVPTCAMVLVL